MQLPQSPQKCQNLSTTPTKASFSLVLRKTASPRRRRNRLSVYLRPPPFFFIDSFILAGPPQKSQLYPRRKLSPWTPSGRGELSFSLGAVFCVEVLAAFHPRLQTNPTSTETLCWRTPTRTAAIFGKRGPFFVLGPFVDDFCCSVASMLSWSPKVGEGQPLYSSILEEFPYCNGEYVVFALFLCEGGI